MKKIVLTYLVATVTLSAFCQQQQLNLDFEVVTNGKPTGWAIFGSPNYLASLDSTVVKNGKYAVEIKHKEGDANFSAWGFTLPHNYAGKKIKLTGYIKAENVTDGYAGLWMRIDPSIAFDNMSGRGIKGTAGWQKVEINLEMRPDKTDQIVVGGLLTGNSWYSPAGFEMHNNPGP